MPLAAARVARLLDAGRLRLAAVDPLANPAWNTDTLTQPGSPHPVAGALQTLSPPPHSAFADTWVP